MTKPTDIDIVTMRALGFEWDEKEGGWKKTGEIPARPGKAIRTALIDSGHIFEATKDAKDDAK